MWKHLQMETHLGSQGPQLPEDRPSCPSKVRDLSVTRFYRILTHKTKWSRNAVWSKEMGKLEKGSNLTSPLSPHWGGGQLHEHSLKITSPAVLWHSIKLRELPLGYNLKNCSEHKPVLCPTQFTIPTCIANSPYEFLPPCNSCKGKG